MERVRIEPLIDRRIVDSAIGNTIGPHRSISRVDDVALRDRERLTGSQRDDAVGLPAGEDRSGKPLGQDPGSRHVIDEARHQNVRLIEADTAFFRNAIVLVLIRVRIDAIAFVASIALHERLRIGVR